MTKDIAAAYVRVSTEEQGDRNLSIPAQLAACRRFAGERGWEAGEVYSDVASGKSDRRADFRRLMDDARRGLFQAIVVYKYSRFGRDLADSMFNERELRQAGVTLVSATEPYDPETVWGWAAKHMMQFFAELENRQKAEFVRAGMRQKLEQGGWNWVAPLGYLNRREELDGRHRRTSVEPDPERAPLVRQAFELYAGGEYGLQALADEVERRGLRTRKGKRLNPKKVLELLTNEFYVGVVSSPTFDVRARGKHPPLVSQDLFDRVQAVVAIRNKGVKRAHRHKQVLRGLVWCACGQRMTIDVPQEGRYAYLRCMSHVDKRREGCHKLGPPVKKVVEQIEEEILPSLHVAPDDVEAVREDLLALSLAAEGDAEEELKSTHLRLAHERARVEALLDMRLGGELDRDEYADKKSEIERSIGIMVARQTELEERRRQRVDSVEMVLRVANSLPVLWREGDEADRRELLELVFEKLVVGKGRIVRPVLREPFRMLEGRRGPVPEVFRSMAPGDGVEAKR